MISHKTLTLISHKTLTFGAVIGLVALGIGSMPAMAQSLGASSSFAVSASAGVTAIGGAVVSGDVGASPTASITGFPPAVITPPWGAHVNDAAAMAAHAANVSLYGQLSMGACDTNPASPLAGATFAPGIHCFAATAVLAPGGNFSLNGAGIYIFRVASALTANGGSTVSLLGGVNPCNVYWQVGSAATLNGNSFAGNVVTQAGVTMTVGASLTGRALATAASVTLGANTFVGGCSTQPAAGFGGAPGGTPGGGSSGCPEITLSPASLALGTIGIAYRQTITASGGAEPYRFSDTAGSPPRGLTLSTAGVLAGTPNDPGSYTFTVTATDRNECRNGREYTVRIATPAEVPTLPGLAKALLAGLLALAGFESLRRRGATPVQR